MWRVEFTEKAQKQFDKLDRQTQSDIVRFLSRLEQQSDPSVFGKALVGEFSGLWRYRVGKYRLICDIQHQRLIVEILMLGKRDSIYG
jgi:mRNA interferase RelE/StbE